nr:ATP phosphoribosyltransferase regulatory subunit [Ruminococcus sp.]
TVCGGGRYDGLIEEFGGDATPAIGFGLGIERLLLRLDESGASVPDGEKPDIYIAPLGDAAKKEAQRLTHALRKSGIAAETDHLGRGLKPQMKYADKLGVKYTLVLGDDEISSGKIRIKNMQSGEQTELAIDDLADFLK